MLANFDAAQLEWRAFAHLSGDKTAIREINEGLDFHSDNQEKFKLPSRLVAKVFLFRNIYCPWWLAERTAYAYSVDNDFKDVGGVKFWRAAIDAFYEKYTGGYEYHKKLKNEATTTGQIISETGRIHPIQPVLRRGQMEWPDSDIANYPVQGFSADLMALARVSAWNRLREYRERGEVLFVNSVHDSIVLDINTDEWYNICITMKKTFRDIPANFEKIYGKKLLVPMDSDAKVGVNWLWQHKIQIQEKDLH